jgi:hypothetical protein
MILAVDPEMTMVEVRRCILPNGLFALLQRA